MLRGLYSAATAMTAAALNQEIVAENLANVATPGYRRHGLIFETLLPDDDGTSESPNTRAGGVSTNNQSATFFEAGPPQQTDNPFDLALTGDGFFVVEGPSGPAYTRNGTFEVNARGELQTKSGLRVKGSGGTINIPPGYRQFTISNTGGISVDGREIGKLEIASFSDPGSLRRVGGTLFQGGNPQTANPNRYQVMQGFRENSNVQPVQEMISMVLGMRHFEAAERSMRMIADAMSQNTKPQN